MDNIGKVFKIDSNSSDKFCQHIAKEWNHKHKKVNAQNPEADIDGLTTAKQFVS